MMHNDSDPAVFCAQASEAALLLNNASLPVLLVPESSGGGGWGGEVWSEGSWGFAGTTGPSNVSRGDCSHLSIPHPWRTMTQRSFITA